MTLKRMDRWDRLRIVDSSGFFWREIQSKEDDIFVTVGDFGERSSRRDHGEEITTTSKMMKITTWEKDMQGEKESATDHVREMVDMVVMIIAVYFLPNEFFENIENCAECRNRNNIFQNEIQFGTEYLWHFPCKKREETRAYCSSQLAQSWKKERRMLIINMASRTILSKKYRRKR